MLKEEAVHLVRGTLRTPQARLKAVSEAFVSTWGPEFKLM